MKNVFLSCDWGTSSFRIRLANTVSLAIISDFYSSEGVASVFEKWKQTNTDRSYFYQAVLQHHITNIETALRISLTQVPIVISGMASSTIGMKELPYKHLPFAASGIDLHYEVIESTNRFPHPIILISGARTENDVMRGEETQLAGCVQQLNDQQQVFIFPGTHSKHIYVQNGYVTHFETYMTGEAFQLLSQNSLLSQSVWPEALLTIGKMRLHLKQAFWMAGTNTCCMQCSWCALTICFSAFPKKQITGI